MDKKITMPARKVDARKFDVVVVGGGTGGIIAAIAAARTGAHTALVEAKGYFGGTLVDAVTALHSFFNNWKTFDREKVQLVRGIPSELVDRVIARGGGTGHCEMEMHYEYDAVCTAVNPEVYKLVAHEMVDEAGVKTFMNTTMIDTLMENGRVSAVLVSNHSGISALEADCFIDATAYGDLCASAGAAFTEPNDKMISAPIGINGVDMDRYAEFFKSYGAFSDCARGLRDGEENQIVRVNGNMALLPEEFRRACKEIGLPLIITATHKDQFLFMKLDYKLPVSPTDRDAMSAAELAIRKNQEKAAKKREKAGLPPQKITQAATQSVRNIQVQENEEPSAEEKEAARKASTEYYNSNQEYRAGSIAAKANMVKQFDEKNSKKKK